MIFLQKWLNFLGKEVSGSGTPEIRLIPLWLNRLCSEKEAYILNSVLLPHPCRSSEQQRSRKLAKNVVTVCRVSLLVWFNYQCVYK